MNYLVALAPSLELSAAEFVTAWNESEQGVGVASVAKAEATTFLTPELTVALIAAAASVPATIVATFVSEYLKKKFIDKEGPKVTVTTISTPDGKPVMIIKQETK